MEISASQLHRRQSLPVSRPSLGPVADLERKLEMKYAGGLIRHLGLQMYSGAVPAIAELISNS